MERRITEYYYIFALWILERRKINQRFRSTLFLMEQSFGLVTTLPKVTQNNIMKIGLKDPLESYWYIIVQSTMLLRINDYYTTMKFGVGLPYEFIIEIIIQGEISVEVLFPGHDYAMLICKPIKYAKDKPQHKREIRETLERQRLIPK